jgi:ParB-like chromosome segregation protein Spo0J
MELHTPKTIEQIPLKKLTPYARNSRVHSEIQVAQLASSIKEFGFTNPVLIDDGNDIIAGHGRVLAATKLGLDTVPCIRLSHLTEYQRRAYVIADNQLALNASWNFDMLSVEIDELNDGKYDISKIGFSTTELAEIIGSPNEIDVNEDEKLISDKKTTICPKCSHEFVN